MRETNSVIYPITNSSRYYKSLIYVLSLTYSVTLKDKTRAAPHQIALQPLKRIPTIPATGILISADTLENITEPPEQVL